MFTKNFDYNLPQELIAQHPITPRDHSRLMVVDPAKKTTQDRHFYDIVDYLQKGDLLVWNNSKVFKARLFGRLESTEIDVNRDGMPDKPLLHNQEVEIFLVRPMENEGVWKVLAKPGRRLKPGMNVRFASDFYCTVMVKEPDGDVLVEFPEDAETVRRKANIYGHIPVPPYVKDEPDQLEMYQTVYAHDAREGSVAAPTAGFHFTLELIEKLKNKGVEFAEVTLHVGLGTFLPVKSERVEDHTMHSEWIELTQENVDKINRAKAEGRRIVAVGTTTVRTLEGVAGLAEYADKKFEVYHGDINIFIKPGFKFQVVDAMITNFHLPKSTLLMLVSAFAGDREFMLECYKQAVEYKYRFYSFGDAMLII
ncbi:MAG TPA: tRNA preQ1(34) S-adenosylmethionine ribosyltransferase-isomerase QueA [Candidatus Magasanikbacteria bacterium]|nr:tRNA preQ1(34) S-adenosylmethionine ribosyltransferase-isomerase QueA [Candidatus Magasanikbacteria bacterium]